MKCPKCGYLGFETSDRCRNCGYDFSLSIHIESAQMAGLKPGPGAIPELPLQERTGAGVPLADLELVEVGSPGGSAAHLDLDRLIGTDAPAGQTAISQIPDPHHSESSVVRTPDVRAARVDSVAPDKGLPLFAPDGRDEPALIATPRPVRPPLSVRRSTPDVPRGRRVTPRPRRDKSTLVLEPDAPLPDDAAEISRDIPIVTTSAGLFARLFAVIVDIVLLGAINATVVYLTLAIAGLTIDEVAVIPWVPMAAFLLLLNGGYLVAFTAACGQTIGKMLTRIRVVSDEGERVEIGRAVMRAAGCLLSLLTAGLGYMPALVTTDARSLHDRLAGTRVVSVQSAKS